MSTSPLSENQPSSVNTWYLLYGVCLTGTTVAHLLQVSPPPRATPVNYVRKVDRRLGLNYPGTLYVSAAMLRY